MAPADMAWTRMRADSGGSISIYADGGSVTLNKGSQILGSTVTFIAARTDTTTTFSFNGGTINYNGTQTLGGTGNLVFAGTSHLYRQTAGTAPARKCPFCSSTARPTTMSPAP